MTVIAWDGTSEYSKESYRAIRIDGRRFLSTTPIGISHLAAAAGRDATYQFFQERTGGQPDTLLMPTDVIELQDGDTFYAVPPYVVGVPEQGLPELEALLREWLRVQPYQSSPGHEEWRADFRARVEAALERPRPALPLKLPPVPVDFEYDTFQRGPALPAPDTILARRGREAWLILRRILGAKAEHVEQRISEAHDWVARQPVLSADILRAESEGAALPAPEPRRQK